MVIDKDFYSGGRNLLFALHDLNEKGKFPLKEEEIPTQVQKDYDEFKTNVDLFIKRLEAAGNSFKNVSNWGRFYVWGHAFIIPLIVATAALVLLIINGNFVSVQ